MRSSFRELELDAAGKAFIDICLAKPHGTLLTLLGSVLRQLLSDFDVNGLLGMYPLFLLSTPQWTQLLGEDRRESLLDIGAGNGDLTAALAALHRQVSVTERSRPMRRRLKARSHLLIEESLSSNKSDAAPSSKQKRPNHFRTVSCLNVLDRTPKPRSLVRKAAVRVAPGGTLVFAVPLPLRPCYYAGPRTLPPEEDLRVRGETWETGVVELASELGELLDGFKLSCVARAPYLSGGDAHQALYELDDAVLVFQQTDAAANAGSE